LQKIATYGGGAGYLAWKAAPKIANAAKVLTQTHGPAVGRVIKTLGTFGKATAGRAVPAIALTMFADEAIGDVITFATNRAAKESGSKLAEYNRTASQWLGESLARSITDPDGKGEIISKILDEYDGVKQATHLTPEEKRNANMFIFELLNKVRSGDDSDVPERFRVTSSGRTPGSFGAPRTRSFGSPRDDLAVSQQAGMMY
jgi:hypothetical protein